MRSIMSLTNEYVLDGSFQAHLSEVLTDSFVPNELKKFEIAVDDFSEFALGDVALVEVAIPPTEHLQREHMKFYVKRTVTHAQGLVEIASGHQKLKRLVLQLHALLMA